MSSSELIVLITALVSIGATIFLSIFTIKHFNNKEIIYQVKKNAIIRSLKLLDDYMSNAPWVDKTKVSVKKSGLNEEYFTIEARECYNELIVTCNDSKLVNCFGKILFSQMFNTIQLHEFRKLSRLELGLKAIDLTEEHAFINYVGKWKD
ncbi:MAG: hypothetical protein FWE36_07970 [Erysipelotrichales bacterium]|nr:hypothetical protein [Erysipelotrichales bacterium]